MCALKFLCVACIFRCCLVYFINNFVLNVYSMLLNDWKHWISYCIVNLSWKQYLTIIALRLNVNSFFFQYVHIFYTRIDYMHLLYISGIIILNLLKFHLNEKTIMTRTMISCNYATMLFGGECCYFYIEIQWNFANLNAFYYCIQTRLWHWTDILIKYLIMNAILYRK